MKTGAFGIFVLIQISNLVLAEYLLIKLGPEADDLIREGAGSRPPQPPPRRRGAANRVRAATSHRSLKIGAAPSIVTGNIDLAG